jgi:CheY-like chemotaxis protein
MTKPKNTLILIADPESMTRSIVADVLRGAGYQDILHCRDGEQLLERTEEYCPRIVITTSRLPKLSGLEYTRLIRAGYRTTPRNLSIIAMTDTPTRAFLEAARESGVDEMLVRPFTADAIMKRVNAVLKRPRRFIDSVSYVGPDRRRRMVEDFVGPMRRLEDPVGSSDSGAKWESPTHRAAMTRRIRAISDVASDWRPGDRKQLRRLRDGTEEIESSAELARDLSLAEAARSLARYITGVGASPTLDPEVVHTHLDAMATLTMLGAADDEQRRRVAEGLKVVVDKRLGRLRDAHRAVLASRL